MAVATRDVEPEQALGESRVESQAESRVESPVESQGESRVESWVESPAESRVESQRESRSQSRVESRVESPVASHPSTHIMDKFLNCSDPSLVSKTFGYKSSPVSRAFLYSSTDIEIDSFAFRNFTSTGKFLPAI